MVSNWDWVYAISSLNLIVSIKLIRDSASVSQLPQLYSEGVKCVSVKVTSMSVSATVSGSSCPKVSPARSAVAYPAWSQSIRCAAISKLR